MGIIVVLELKEDGRIYFEDIKELTWEWTRIAFIDGKWPDINNIRKEKGNGNRLRNDRRTNKDVVNDRTVWELLRKTVSIGDRIIA